MHERTFPVLSRRTLGASALGAGEPTTRALTPPVYVAATYVRGEYSTGFVFGRSDSISIHQVEALIAELEHASEAMMFRSGTAAAATIFLSFAPAHIVAPKLMYRGLQQCLYDLPRYGHEVTFVDMSDLAAFRTAIIPGRTGLVWIETPSNPLWTITDIQAVSDCAHQAGAVVCVDSTASTPILTSPLDCGSDLVVHSATKYFNGGQRRDFVHVRDVAAATVLACETHGTGVAAFNAGPGTPRTVGEMARALAASLKGPSPVVTGRYRLGDVRHITADSSRLRTELNWAPAVAFEDGMAELAHA